MNILAAETSEQLMNGTQAFGSNISHFRTHSYIGVEMNS